DRPDAPEREPLYCERVGPVELQGGEESGRGTHQQPDGGAHQILEGDADGRAIAGRGSTEGRVLASPLEHGDSSRSWTVRIKWSVRWRPTRAGPPRGRT